MQSHKNMQDINEFVSAYNNMRYKDVLLVVILIPDDVS